MGTIGGEQHQMNLENDQQQFPHHQHYPRQEQVATTGFHVSRQSHAISAIITPPTLNHTSIILDDDSFHVSRIMENYQVS